MRQFPSRQQNPVFASEAFKADIRSQPDNFPFIPSAWVGFTQADLHPQLNFRQHARIISHVIIPKLWDGDEKFSLSLFPTTDLSMLGLSLPILISRIITLLIAMTVHEFCHAWVAVSFGDETPRLQGRLTLNPLRHLDPMGSILLLVAGFGWAKPVMINPYAFERKSPLALMWVSLAGPFSNFMLAAIAAIPFRFHLIPLVNGTSAIFPSFAEFLYDFMIINLTLMLFNLIPLAPLDGEKIAVSVLPPSWGRFLERIAPYSTYILLAVVFILPLVGVNLLSAAISPPLNSLMNLLAGL
jgi:Zn-dependent protease